MEVKHNLVHDSGKNDAHTITSVGGKSKSCNSGSLLCDLFQPKCNKIISFPFGEASIYKGAVINSSVLAVLLRMPPALIKM